MGEKTTRLEIYPKIDAEYPTLKLRGDKATVMIGGNETDGFIALSNKDGNTSIQLYGSDGIINLHDNKTLEISIALDASSRKITLQDTDLRNTIKLGGDDASIISGDKGKAGALSIRNNDGTNSITLRGETGDIVLLDSNGHHSFGLHGFSDHAGLWIGGNGSESEGKKAGHVYLRDANGKDSIHLDGRSGDIFIKNSKGNDSITLSGETGDIFIKNSKGNDSITLRGETGDIVLLDSNGHHSFGLHGFSDQAGLWIGGNGSASEGKKAGHVYLRDANGKDSIHLDGTQGDIILNNADCAEDFDISGSEDIEPGSVMVIEEEGKLQQSNIPYDKRVAGVISGAGDYKPGLVLDKKQSHNIRKSISLMGKVHCKVDAQTSPIEVGDLLTTSYSQGHAMKASDPLKAFGAVIGKALRQFKDGKGLIPILIALE